LHALPILCEAPPMGGSLRVFGYFLHEQKVTRAAQPHGSSALQVTRAALPHGSPALQVAAAQPHGSLALQVSERRSRTEALFCK
jgi:hypothetical protein